MSSKQHKQKISDTINNYIQLEKWTAAKNILEKELISYPKEHWLLTMLATVHYELRNYKTALKFSNKALKIESSDYLVIYNHACILSVMEGKEIQAIMFLEKIIITDLNEIAYGEYGEGMRWAKSLVNDSRVRLALVYSSIRSFKKALYYFKVHLEQRERGVFSNFSKREILHKLSQLAKVTAIKL